MKGDEYFIGDVRRSEPPASEQFAQFDQIAAGNGAKNDTRPPVRPAWTAAPVGARPRRNLGLVLAVAITVAVAAGAFVVVHGRAGSAYAIGGSEFAFRPAASGPTEIPISHPTRVLPAVAAPAGGGGYTVLRTARGAPVAWDPCEPIHVVVRPDGAIPGGSLMLEEALAEVSKETGLFFMDDGSTDEAPSLQRNPFQKSRYGDKWAPVLIAWTNAHEIPALAGDVIGLGGPISVAGKDARNVSGEVLFDAPDLDRVLAVPDGAAYVHDVMLHELGHLVGLGHVDDPNEVMNPVSLRALPGYGEGDLRGLAQLGSGRCFSKA